MWFIRLFVLFSLFMAYHAGDLHAHENVVLYFANYIDEELYVEFSVEDNSGWMIYDLYVAEGGLSAAEFWIDDSHAVYSACAYGDISGDFFGCIEGRTSDLNNMINFDNSGIPYTSEPSEDMAEWFVFDHPEHPTRILLASSGGCFVAAMD